MKAIEKALGPILVLALIRIPPQAAPGKYDARVTLTVKGTPLGDNQVRAYSAFEVR